MNPHSKKPAPFARGGPSEGVLLGGEPTEYSPAHRSSQAATMAPLSVVGGVA